MGALGRARRRRREVGDLVEAVHIEHGEGLDRLDVHLRRKRFRLLLFNAALQYRTRRTLRFHTQQNKENRKLAASYNLDLPGHGDIPSGHNDVYVTPQRGNAVVEESLRLP